MTDTAYIVQQTGGGFLFGVLVLGMILIVQGIPIWISVNAKPLGDRPYRWGTYVGIITALVGIILLLTSNRLIPAFLDGNVIGPSLIVCLLVCAALCSIGILRRRKFGVVMFVITYLALIMVGPFLDAMRNQPATPRQQGQSFPVLVFLVITTIYFKKRWRLMTSTTPPVAPLPSAITLESDQEL